MAATEILKNIPIFGADVMLLLRRPRRFVQDRLVTAVEPASAMALLGWALGCALFVWALYSYFLGSPVGRLYHALNISVAQTSLSQPIAKEQNPVRFVGLAWLFRYVEVGEGVSGEGVTFPIGLSIDFPQIASMGTDRPQIAIFGAGIGRLVLDNVVPATIAKSRISTGLLFIYAIMTTLCLHPPLRLLGSHAQFRDTARFCVVAYSAVVLLTVVLTVVGSLVLLDALHFKGFWLITTWLLLVWLPTSVLSVRVMLVGLAELHKVSKRRLIVASAGGVVLSAVISPLVFFPAVYVLVKYSEFWSIVG